MHSLARPDQSSGWYRRWGKTLLDLILGVPLTIAFLPLMAVIALVIRVTQGAPALFRQSRLGLRGVPFRIIKFRTMREATGPEGLSLPDSERITGFGAMLRAASLDELPELFNVLRGDMSLVGPRPLLARYYEWFTPAERERFAVRPGITGLAQVSGRNDLSWDERIAADLRYVQECYLGPDLRVLLLTMARVLTRRGLRVDPGATMLDFDEERRRRASGGPIR